MNIITRIILIAIPIILIFIGAIHPLLGLDQDLGRHMLIGKIILQSKTVPSVNLLSYTFPLFPFINHHWLSEVIFYITKQVSGFGGLWVTQAIFLTLPFLLLFTYAVIKKGNLYIISILSLIYIMVLSERQQLRPELFSFLLLSCYLIILFRFREKYTRFIFILPVLQAFWVNLHIYFFVGILVVGLFFVDNLFTQRKKIYLFLKKRAPLPSQIIIIGLVLGGVVLVNLFNPNGLMGALYPFFVFHNYGYSIEENQNILFLWNYSQKPTIIFFTISSLLLWSGIIFAYKKIRAIDLLLGIPFTILAITQVRNLPLFVFTTFLSCIFTWSILTDQLKRKLTEKNRSIFLTGYFVIFFCLFFFEANIIIQKSGFGYAITESGKDALDFFTVQKLKGPIFNNFDIGSYIDYRLYPKEKVFVDGRPEAYPSYFFQDTYIPMQENKKIFDKTSNQYNFNAIIFSHIDQTPWAMQFILDITKNKSWKLVYLDPKYCIFLKDSPFNQRVIERFYITEKSYKIPSHMNIVNYAMLIRFFSLSDWQEKEEEAYYKILEKYPSSCFALQNLIKILSGRNDPATPSFVARLNSCKE